MKAAVAGIDWRQLRREYLSDRKAFLADMSNAIETGELSFDDRDVSIRNLYMAFGGPYELEALNPHSKGGYKPAQEAGIPVFSSDFANTIGQLMYSKIMEGYSNPALFLSSLIPTVPTSFLDGEKIPGMRSLSDKSLEVPEGGEFPTAAFQDDYIQTPATKKRGLKVELTKEAIWADRTGLAVRRAYDVGEQLAFNKEDRLWDMVLGYTNSYNWRGTAYNTYQTATPWINDTTSVPLSTYASLDSLEQLWLNMTDPESGQPIQLNPAKTYLLTTPAMRNTARFILNGTELNRGVITSTADVVTDRVTMQTPFWNSYIHHADIRMARQLAARSINTSTYILGDISKAFAYAQAWGLQVLRAPNLAPAEFDRDIALQLRADERGIAYVENPRYVIRAR